MVRTRNEIGLVLFSCSTFLQVCQADDDPNLRMAKAGLIACEANFTALRTYKCRYTITKANASSPDEALKGNYFNVKKCEFLLAVDGEKRKLQSLTPIDTTPPKNLQEGINPSTGQKAKFYTIDFGPVGELRNGDTALSYLRQFNQAQVFKELAESRDEIEDTPLSKVNWKASDGIRSWREAVELGRATVSSRGLVIEAGQALIHTEYSLDSRLISLYLDPNRGYLPGRCVQFEPTSVGQPRAEFQTHLLDAKDVGKGRWFPMHSVAFMVPTKKGDPIALRDIQVAELVVDKVTAADLELEIAAGTTVYREDMPVGGKEYFTFRQNEKISPTDIARLEKMLKEAGERPLMDTAVHAKGKGSNLKWYLILGGAVLLVIAIFLYRRFRLRNA
jgi:hypothetical protein